MDLLIDDQSLSMKLRKLVGDERQVMAEFVVYLAEFDRRRLYAPEGFSSSYAWLTEHLKLSNASAFRRVTAARLLARMPVVADYLRDGRITLTKLGFLKDILTEENCRALLDQSSTLPEKDVEALATTHKPERTPPRDSVRPLPPAPKPPAPPVAPDLFSPRPAAVPPVPPSPPQPQRHQIAMTVGPDFMARLAEVRAALSHSHPRATLEALFDECMKVTLVAHRKRVEG